MFQNVNVSSLIITNYYNEFFFLNFCKTIKFVAEFKFHRNKFFETNDEYYIDF